MKWQAGSIDKVIQAVMGPADIRTTMDIHVVVTDVKKKEATQNGSYETQSIWVNLTEKRRIQL